MKIRYHLSILSNTPFNRIQVFDGETIIYGQDGDVYMEKLVRALVTMANEQELSREQVQLIADAIKSHSNPIRKKVRKN